MKVKELCTHDNGDVEYGFYDLTDQEWIALFKQGRKILPNSWDEGEIVAAAILQAILNAVKYETSTVLT